MSHTLIHIIVSSHESFFCLSGVVHARFFTFFRKMARPKSSRAAVSSLSEAGPMVAKNCDNSPRQSPRGSWPTRGPGPVSVASAHLKKIVGVQCQSTTQKHHKAGLGAECVGDNSEKSRASWDLEMLPYKFPGRHRLMEVQRKATMVEKCRLVLARSANGRYLATLFADENIFTVGAAGQNTHELSCACYDFEARSCSQLDSFSKLSCGVCRGLSCGKNQCAHSSCFCDKRR